jgi:hypothetical protein
MGKTIHRYGMGIALNTQGFTCAIPYEFKVEVYVLKEELSRAKPRVTEHSCRRHLRVHG